MIVNGAEVSRQPTHHHNFKMAAVKDQLASVAIGGSVVKASPGRQLGSR